MIILWYVNNNKILKYLTFLLLFYNNYVENSNRYYIISCYFQIIIEINYSIT